jgi:hypothetical protein
MDFVVLLEENVCSSFFLFPLHRWNTIFIFGRRFRWANEPPKHEAKEKKKFQIIYFQKLRN